ncbi:MAG: thioredoxin domain-containing protein [Deltaproteobacteria bacterium]|nr:thioredoxin domain-containing protein [Deltaproteobacteria bacterium]
MKRRWVLSSVILMIAIVVYISFFIFSPFEKKVKVQNSNGNRDPSNTNIVVTLEPPDTVYKIIPHPSRLIYGQDDAIVKVILFADFSNKKSSEALRTLKELVNSNNSVAVYLYSFPIYQNEFSIPLSNLFLISIDKGKKGDFVNFIENTVIKDESSIIDFVERHKIDVQKVFEQYLENELSKLPALDDMNLGVNFGVKIPPTFFVNGVRVDGLKTKDELQTIIENELAKAEKILDAGVNRSEVYHLIVKNGKETAYKVKVVDRVEHKEKTVIDDNIYEEDLRFVPIRGPRYAYVTIVVFVDYECPYTKRFFRILNSLYKNYEKDVRIFVKHYPLSTHKRSYEVAKILAAALVQRKFWVLFEKIMETPEFTDEEKIYDIAMNNGIDLEQLKSMRDSDRVKKYVEDDLIKGRELGIKVLPTTYINGVRYEGVLSSSFLEKIIKDEKRLAERLIGEGIKMEELYDNIVRRNKVKNFFTKGIQKPYIEKIK